MRSEIAKLRTLPTPRLLLAGCAGALGITVVVLALVGPSGHKSYEDAVTVVTGLTTTISSIVLGVWIVGVEYAQGTMRRTIAASPRRGRVIGAKLALAVGGATLVTFVLMTLASLLGLAAASLHGVSLSTSHMIETSGQALAVMPLRVVLAFGLVLLMRSMAAGATAAFIVMFVLEGALSAIPSVGDYTFGSVLTDVGNYVAGHGHVDQPGVSFLVAFAWLIAVIVPAWVRFVRTDIA